MATEFERTKEAICGKSVTITSWFDADTAVWRASAPQYTHLLAGATTTHAGSSTRRGAVGGIMQVLAERIPANWQRSDGLDGNGLQSEALPRVYVGGITPSDDVTEIADLFVPFGKVLNVRIVNPRGLGEARRFAFVDMEDDAAAEAAIRGLNGVVVAGRNLAVSWARAR